MKLGIAAALGLLGLLDASHGAFAAELPSGTKVEVRLSTATGSRVSHRGDAVEALVIAPVYAANRLIIPPGAILSGTVESLDQLGLGFKHETARINYRFTSLRFPDGSVFSVEARTAEVETARERVSGDGDIRGINPNVNLSSGASIVISALIADVHLSIPALGVKFLLARSPDPEIYFPAGTELILQLAAGARFPDLDTPPIVHELGIPDERAVETVLNALPDQQTSVGRNRPSDLVNIVLLGDREEIQRAFHAAGWYGEQRHSALALYRMYHCLVQRTGYKMAPMTRLRLNGRYPDAVYQKSLDTFSKRHHIRLWQNGNSGEWVGAATQDVAYTFRRMHLTHASDAEIDNERAKIVNDLWLTGCVSEASLLRRDQLRIQPSGGPSISTDGDVAVLRLNECQTRTPTWMPGNKAPSVRNYSFRQILVAIGADLAHSNPFTLGYTFSRAILSGATVERTNSFRSASLSPHARARFSDTASRVEWKRPSIADPELAVSPSLTASNVH